MKVSLFVTCLVDQLFPEIGSSSLRLLERMGVTVAFDSRQTCCGQPAFNSGYQRDARTVARYFLEIYEEAERIVVPSGSCATMIKIFLPTLFEKDSKEETLARQIGGRTHELSDFLVSVLGVEETGAHFNESVTYHDSCHLLRELGISEAPRTLIRNVRGIDFRELQEADRCCGFGGLFSVKYGELSSAMGRQKLNRIEQSGARYVVAADVSCLMHLSGLIQRQGSELKTLHLAQLLASNF